MKQLLDNGYCRWEAPHLADMIDTSHLIFDDLTHHTSRLPINEVEYVEYMLNVLHRQIAEEYIKPYAQSCELLEYDIKGSLPETSKFCEWHSDSDEPSNVFFLLYFNDMTQYDEGALLVGNDRIVPKYGDLIAIENTNPNILHKAEVTKYRRIVACFDYIVQWK